MRTAAGFVCCLLLAFSAFGDEKANTGDLHIHAHLGARIYVDGHLAGVSLGEKLGFTVPNLPAGPHTIRVTRLDYSAKQLTVTVMPGTAVDVNMDDLKIRRRIKVRPREEPVDMTVGSPPMSADDTGTPGSGNWEINTSFEGDVASGQHEYQLPLIDANYGLNEDLQLKYEVPCEFVRERGDDGAPRNAHGIGNSVLGLKDRFYDNEESGLSLAVYPQAGFRTPGSKSRDDGGAGQPGFLLLPLLLTKDLKTISFTANVSVEKMQGESRGILAAIFGAGMRLSPSVALLGEIAANDAGSSDGRRFSIRTGLRKKIDENQVLFASISTDLNGGDDGLHHRYITLGYQRFIGQKEH